MVSYNRMVIGGPMGTAERWSIGLNFMPNPTTPANYVEGQDNLNGWADEFAAYLSAETPVAIKNLMSSQCSIDTVIAQRFNPAGELVAQSVPADPTWTGAGGIECPYQTALVVSILTGRPGASYRGRVYLPALNVTMTAAGTITGNDAVLTNFQGWIEAIQDASIEFNGGGSQNLLCVMSKTRGLVTLATQLRCGNVLDTQRRRRDALTETYVAVSL